ncbi:uncharacterized protein si:dkeyp-72g9.4 [Trichomycterus rosablanca]|uniref:uncharacterized protein si:dkeyp-72g9.4 n=1 Tax=Trichomycterus rosablanca TaxID=2290929 RepID=UPI002F353DEE
MRPRSRLLAKRGLPTIREGSEELVHDLNQTNSQHNSAQDYFHSICQLAQPTFPLREPDRDILSIGTLDSPKPCLRPHRVRQLVQPLTPSSSPCTSQPPKEDNTQPAASEPVKTQGSEQDRFSSTDPLEYLYGYRGAEASSCLSKCSSNTRPCSASNDQQKSSSELRLAESVPSPAVPQRSPLSRKKLDSSKFDGTPCGLRAKNTRSMDKQTMVSHWISECRSAWREARNRACMLPAIAET